ncbi:hypothetical protein Tco_1191360 [Tanacetum coccineum]
MAEEQDDQQQQQNMMDVELVSFNEQTVIEEVGQSEEVAEDVDFEETDEEPLVRRIPTRVVISGEVCSESDDEGLDHSKKLKGLETLSEAA